MTDYALIPHRNDEVQPGLRGIVARVELKSPTEVAFDYRLTGDLSQLAIPHRWRAQRAERLWEHTCFEAFVAPKAGSRYFELNFSPSTQWAAYELDGYRQGMRPLELAKAPAVAVAMSAGELRVSATVDFGGLPGTGWPWHIGLTAVVEDRVGKRAHFALLHPRETPDFHDAAGFTISFDGSAR